MIAINLNRIAAGKDPLPFKYLHLGALAYIGAHKVVADMGEKFQGSAGFSSRQRLRVLASVERCLCDPATVLEEYDLGSNELVQIAGVWTGRY